MIDLERILKAEPTLTPYGIELTQTNEKYDADYLQQIEICIDWLKDKPISQKFNYHSTSYGIKHKIERELDVYIANGCLIAAIIYLGIPYKRIPNSPNIYVAIEEKVLSKNDPNRARVGFEWA
ncbi:MAG: hypothetical protein V1773_06975 [bacterium]